MIKKQYTLFTNPAPSEGWLLKDTCSLCEYRRNMWFVCTAQTWMIFGDDIFNEVFSNAAKDYIKNSNIVNEVFI